MVKNQIEIRSYTPQDYQPVQEILDQGGLFYEDIDSAERLAVKIRRDPESIMVAVSEGKVVGTARIMEDGSMAFAFRIAVSEDHRGSGIGKMLTEEAARRLKLRGYNEMHILVERGDEKLQQYYQKLRFEIGGDYRWMALALK